MIFDVKEIIILVVFEEIFENGFDNPPHIFCLWKNSLRSIIAVDKSKRQISKLVSEKAKNFSV